MKINKGLGYLATAAIAITIIIVTKDVKTALGVAVVGLIGVSFFNFSN